MRACGSGEPQALNTLFVRLRGAGDRAGFSTSRVSSTAGVPALQAGKIAFVSTAFGSNKPNNEWGTGLLGVRVELTDPS